MPPKCILVVDDNVDSARGLAVLLSSWGHEVHLAHEGRAAIAAARRLRPEIVFLDLGLPGIDGFQVAATLRHEAALQTVRIIAVTALTQDDDRRRAMEAGIDQHLTKPVSAEFLKSLLGPADERRSEPAGLSSKPLNQRGDE